MSTRFTEEGFRPIVRKSLDRKILILREHLDEFRTNVGKEPRVRKRGSDIANIFVAVGNLFQSIISGLNNLFGFSSWKDIQKENEELIHRADKFQHDLDIVAENQVTLKERIEGNEDVMELMAVANNLNDELDNSIEVLDAINSAFVSLHHGLTPTSIFSVREAESAFRRLKDTAAMQAMELTIDDSLLLYASDSSYYLVKELLDLVIHVKCYNTEKSLEIYQKPNLPVQVREDVFDILDDDQFIGTTPGLQKDVAIVSMPNLDQCNEFSSKKFICKDLMIQTRYEDSCIANLFLYQNLDSCDLKEAKLEPRYWYSYRDQLFLFFPRPAKIAILCKEENKYMTLVGLHQYNLPDDCALHTDWFYLHGRISPVEVNATVLTHSVSLNHIDRFSSELPLDEITLKIINSSHIVHSRKHDAFVNANNIQSSFIGLAIVMSIGIATFLGIRSCQLSRTGPHLPPADPALVIA